MKVRLVTVYNEEEEKYHIIHELIPKLKIASLNLIF
jgi:hypothetical protein